MRAWLICDSHSMVPVTDVMEPGVHEHVTLDSPRLATYAWLLLLGVLDKGDSGSRCWVPVHARSLEHSTPTRRGRRRRRSTCVMTFKKFISRNKMGIPDLRDNKTEPKPPYKTSAVSPSLKNVYLICFKT